MRFPENKFACGHIIKAKIRLAGWLKSLITSASFCSKIRSYIEVIRSYCNFDLSAVKTA